MNKTLYLEMSGGLGNQMFQYAFARYLQECFDCEIILLTKSYKSDMLRDLSIDHFCIIDTMRTSDYDYFHHYKIKHLIYKLFNKIDRIRDKIKGYDYLNPSITYMIKHHIFNKMGIYTHSSCKYLFPKKPMAGSLYSTGAWHTPLYADKIKNILEKEFSLQPIYKCESQLLHEINDNESVCVHVRRGDYLNYSYYNVCDLNYYKRSIKYFRSILSNPVFYVFSDSIDWVKENLLEEAVYVEERNPDYIDFNLMKSCKHFIISNSTFSWWAAYLGKCSYKKVITPDKWYTDDYGENKPQLNLNDWIAMKTKEE